MRILAIGAHPDDVDLLCGGTLLQLASAGHELIVAIATNGNVGSPTMDRDEIAAVRHAEASRSCARLGAKLIWMDFDDEWLFNDRATRTVFIDAIRTARAEVIFVHSPADYHPDHRNAGQIALDARIPSAVRLVETSTPHLDAVPRVYLMDTVGQDGFRPDVYVDVSATINAKAELLRLHESQAGWMSDLYGMDFVEHMRAGNAARGVEAGVPFAEAFQLVRTYPETYADFRIPGEVFPQ